MNPTWIINSRRIEDYLFTVLELDHQIIYICAHDNFDEKLKVWIHHHFSLQIEAIDLVNQSTTINNQALDQIEQYFQGKITELIFPFKLYGSEQEIMIWEELAKVKYQEIIAYSDLATRIGKPKAVRYVGTTVGKNPLLIMIPCHRVIRKNGELGGFSAGIPLKERLQALEKSH